MKKHNILIVEDNKDHLYFIKKALSDKMYNLHCISSGTEAYNYLLNPKIKPDLVLLDNHLPGMTGLEILKKIGAKKKDYGFVFLTIDKSIEIVVEAMNLGVMDFIVKTPNLQYELSQKIKKIYKTHKEKAESLGTEANFKSIMESSADSICAVDTHFNLTSLNQSFKDSFIKSYNIEFKKGDNIFNKNFPRHVLDFWKVKYNKALLGESLIFEFSPKYKGKLLHFEIRLNPITIRNTVVGVSYISRNITDRKKIENELSTKNQLLSKHMNNTPLAAIYIDIHSIVKEWNKAAEKIFGYTEQEALGKNIIDLVVPKSIKGKIKSVCKAIKSGGGNDTNQNINITKQGKTILCNWYNTLITNQNKEPIGVASLVEDITERKFYEEKIRQSDAILNKINSIVLVINNKGDVTYASKGVKLLLGFEPREVLGNGWWEKTFTDSDLALKRRKSALEHFFDNKTFSIDTSRRQLKTKQGNYKWFEWTLSKGIGNTYIAIGLDITKRHDKDSQYKAIIKTANDAIVLVNHKGTIIDWNRAATKIFGYTKKEILGKPVSLLIPKKYIGLHQKAFGKSNKRKTAQKKDRRAEGLRKNGQLFPIELSLNTWQSANKMIFCAFIKDVTEKRQLEQNFIHAFIDAQEVEKQSFGEDLHDGISQILSAESMYIDVLIKLNKQSKGKIHEYLDKIKTLNLSAINEARSIAHGLMSKQLKENGLLKALEHICDDYNNTKNIIFNYSSKNIKEVEISKEIKTNLFRITQEISTNTIRHSGATKAEVRLSKINNNQLKLVVKDNGVGIDFDKMKRENKGAGFKNIERRVKLLNGKIDIKTAPNKGTFFTITIPL
ncbi:MAG: PAS domain S-box protein [Flavobacteriaceae bacterium]|nr:PAS domain S-box protein [Flavobacteriaceae bacterium]